MKIKKQKGITLVALIITIILMLIVVGVILNLTLGDNGLIKIATSAAQKYKEEEIKEKVELAIANVLAKELALGNDITVESILQELLEDETFESIDKENSIGNIGEYEVKLKENEDGRIVIEYVQKADGIRITYTINPKGYTNKEKVSILFKVQGKVKNTKKPDGLMVYPQENKIAIDYEVDKNGIYQFIVENEEGTTITKDVIVDTIDRLSPLEFEITAQDTGTGIKIIANAKDAEADETNVKSGIEKYEYYLKKDTDLNYPEIPYTEDTITNLKSGTYKVYVVAYDKAKNKKQSKEIEVKLLGVQVGDFVNYKAGNWTQKDMEELGVVFDTSGNITDYGPLYEGENLPTVQGKFGGFKLGQSKDESITSGEWFNFIYSGWRVLSLNEDGSIKEIIHAGSTEAYYHQYKSNNGYKSQYILGGGKEVLADDNIFDGLTERNWSMYEDTTFAIQESARMVNYDELNAIQASNSLRATGGCHWVTPAMNSDTLRNTGDTGSWNWNNSFAAGVRIVVTLKKGVKVKNINASGITHTTPETAWDLTIEE